MPPKKRDEETLAGMVRFSAPPKEETLELEPMQYDLMLPYVMDTTQVAEFFGVNRSTVYRWEKQGLLKSVKIGNMKRFKATDVKAFADQRQ